MGRRFQAYAFRSCQNRSVPKNNLVLVSDGNEKSHPKVAFLSGAGETRTYSSNSLYIGV